MALPSGQCWAICPLYGVQSIPTDLQVTTWQWLRQILPDVQLKDSVFHFMNIGYNSAIESRVKETNFGQAGYFIHALELAFSYIYLAPIKRMPFFTSNNESHFPVYIQHLKTSKSLGDVCVSSCWRNLRKKIIPCFFHACFYHVRIGNQMF